MIGACVGFVVGSMVGLLGFVVGTEDGKYVGDELGGNEGTIDGA